jgi:16S rRNA (cytosine967-C5)-methyltransferase
MDISLSAASASDLEVLGVGRANAHGAHTVLRNDAKSKPHVSPARSAAFDILMRVAGEDSYASELLHSSFTAQLSPADHRLTTELVMGVLRWRASLDAAIARASALPIPKLDPQILIALRLGAYQLRFLERIPPHAAIDESVELVKRARKRSAAPFVNAVLRKLLSLPHQEPSSPAKSAIDLAEHYSHPEWLVARWVKAFGLDSAEKICEYNQQIPHVSIRLRNISAEAELQKQGIQLAPGELLSSARRVLSGDLTSTESFHQGSIAIQDEASQLVALLVGGGRILDCCAAPGGKTAILADRNPGSKITAIELHPHRARLLRRLLPADNVKVAAADARHLPFGGTFESVLVDVPCSGTGTLARNPEIKWKLRPEDLVDLKTRQIDILRSAAARVISGGHLVYSTCSLEQEENSDLVEQFLTENNSFKIVDCRETLDQLRAEGELVWPQLESLVKGPYLRTIPGVHPCDGFFAAILQKA